MDLLWPINDDTGERDFEPDLKKDIVDLTKFQLKKLKNIEMFWIQTKIEMFSL
jgi:hypothetical protein